MLDPMYLRSAMDGYYTLDIQQGVIVYYIVSLDAKGIGTREIRVYKNGTVVCQSPTDLLVS